MTHSSKMRILSGLIAIIMVLSLSTAAVFAVTVDEICTPGVYTGQADGYGGGVSVSVTLSQSGDSVVISEITAEGPDETQGRWEKALTILDSIKSQNGTEGLIEKLSNKEIDTVSGATISAKAIVNAAEDAVSKAVFGFAGGTGKEDDPYQISSEAGLRYLQSQVAAGTTYAGQYFELTADIQLTGEWIPIGSGTSQIFAGSFDGKGHTIDGMTITDETLGYAGLFGYVQNGTVIRNVNLTNVSIKIEESEKNIYAGSLAAFAKVDSSGSASTIVDGCTASGSIYIGTENKVTVVGGLVGFSDQRAAVTNCSTDVDITADSGTGRATVGGLAAWTSVKALFMNDYSLGDISVSTECIAYDNVGAMFGQLNGIVYNCYTAGTITLISENAPTPAGAFAGNAAAASYIDSCYYADKKAPVFGTESGTHNSQTVLLKSSEEIAGEDLVQLLHNNLSSSGIAAMQTNTAAANVSGCGDFSALTARVDNRFQDWALIEGVVALTGELWTSGDIDASIFAGGNGTNEDPYVITTARQLCNFAESLNDKIDYTNKFVALGDDISLAGVEWSPIGGSNYLFNGTFDGRGHTVSGMSMGTEKEPYEMDRDNIYVGMFGILGPDSLIRNVNLTDVYLYSAYEASGYVGGIAGAMQGSTVSGDFTGAVIDSCSVSGTISHTGSKGNQFVGGLVGMQYKGAVINSCAQVNAAGVVMSGDLAEVGGLVGLNNRGLVANCWSDSTIYGSGNRDNGNEGMAVVSNLVGCNAGVLVNCYGSGDITTREHSTYAGMVSGWVTGIGKSYNCWYNLDSTMKLKDGDPNPQIVNPVESIGTKVASGVNDEGDAYTGGLVDNLNGYKASDYADIADGLNGSFSAFPVDISVYGLGADSLKNWVYDSSIVTFGDTNGAVNYIQPECEKYTAPEPDLKDGIWYGRDEEKTTVVRITVENSIITETEVISGSDSGNAYDSAVEKAKYKATYGDFSHYEAADTSQFEGGTGTQEDPYLISGEAQLRYLSSSVNEDVDWSGVYFKQTRDITLTGGDWTPIGWSISGDVDGAQKTICAYYFRGNYDGGDYTITGLTIGTAENPADQNTSGLFGLTSGSYTGNEKPDGTEQVVELKNIHLQDLSINVSTRYQTYTGGLVGSGQNGIYIDNCSVAGTINAAASESFARGGGLAASVMRGAVTNSWADVDINAVTDSSHVYAGGLFGMDNRVTTVNCYVLGDITGNAGNNNKVHIGGLTGQAGGIHVNCYAAGNVISLKTTSDAGILNGRAAGINVEYNCYYNTEAVLKQGDTTVSPAEANGVTVDSAVEVNIAGKKAAELVSESFASLLNSNIASGALADTMSAVNAAVENSTSGLTQQNYYRGNALQSWVLKDDTVTFGKVYYGGSTSGGGSSGYSISIPSGITGGTLEVNPGNAEKGRTVTLTVVPDSGYMLNNLAVTDSKGNPVNLTDEGSGRYSFIMPDSMVTVEADFINEKTVSNFFTDVQEEDYFYEAVLWAVENGITEGTSDTTFSPYADCTRAQIVTFLWRAAGCPEPVSSENPFTDVSEDSYFYKAVLWAVENGITEGTGSSTFSPDLICTRDQAVTFLWRAAGKPAGAGDNPFTDVKNGTWYTDAVLWAVENSITEGTGGGTFSPDSNCIRGQIVTFLYRSMK